MLKPTNNRILVELEKQPKQQGLIIIPDKIYRDKPVAATIVAKGDKVNPDLQIGMRILVPNYGGLPVEKNDKQYKLFTDVEVHGILNDFAEVNV